MTKRGRKAWLHLDGLEALRHQVDPAFTNPAWAQDDEPQLCGLQADPRATRRRGAGEGRGVGKCNFKVNVPLTGAGEQPRVLRPGALGARPACARWTRRRRAWSQYSSAVLRQKVPLGRRSPCLTRPPRLDPAAAGYAQPPEGFRHSQGMCFSWAAPKRKFMSFLTNFAFYFLECSQIDKLKCRHTRKILPFRKHRYSNPSLLGFSWLLNLDK